MALNLNYILQHVGESLEEFSKNVSISQEDLINYGNGTVKPTTDVYSKISDYTALPWEQIESTTIFEGRKSKIVVNDTWAPSEKAKVDLNTYLEEGIDFSSDEVLAEIKKFRECISNWRKPKVVFAGQSDTGKSTIINELIGGENVPAKWTPTTSISTYIKHVDDRPNYISDEVWIFGKKEGEIWDEKLLCDEQYTRDFMIAKGNIDLLEKYGTHQGNNGEVGEAYSAVVFLDADILKDCDIVDLPGFAASEEDNAIHEVGTQNSVTDILVYLSRANGFLQDRDLDYLKVCIDSLRAIEKPNSSVGKLGNLFIVATHAKSINNGNSGELKQILDTQSKKLSDILRKSVLAAYGEDTTLLPKRTELTSLRYQDEDIRNRFFTYDKSMDRLNRKCFEAIEVALEQIPFEIQQEFCQGLSNVAEESKTVLKDKIVEYTRTIEDTNKYIELAKKLKAKEPARKADQEARTKDLKKKIENYRIKSQQDIKEYLAKYLCEDNLINEINENEVKNKKSAKADFATQINTTVNTKIQKIIDDKSKDYAKDLDEFLKKYSSSIESIEGVEGVEAKLDANKMFAMAISGLAAVGASATWLATSFVADAVLFFSNLAPMSYFAAFGGIIGIAITGLLATAYAVYELAVGWKSHLAKNIISAYQKNNFEKQILDKSNQYWDDTLKSLEVGCKKIEDEWSQKIKEFESLSDETQLKKRIDKVSELKRGLSFFEKMPMPNIG